MSGQMLDINVGHGEHAVHFYVNDSDLARTVGGYLADAISSGAVAVVIATEAHRRAFQAELADAGIVWARVVQERRLLPLDAAKTLSSFVVDGGIDAEGFRRVIGPCIRAAAETGRPVCAYGEMVALLWEAGNVTAAIELEALWNELAHQIEFSLLCAYRSESLTDPDHAEALQRVCDLHSSVSHGELQVARDFPAEIDAPRAARHFVAGALRQWGYGGRLLDDAAIVLSELATNAVVHACSPFSVVARRNRCGIRLAVSDASVVAPVASSAAPDAPSGRGLQVVAALSRAWGVETTDTGKIVWAELRR